MSEARPQPHSGAYWSRSRRLMSTLRWRLLTGGHHLDLVPPVTWPWRTRGARWTPGGPPPRTGADVIVATPGPVAPTRGALALLVRTIMTSQAEAAYGDHLVESDEGSTVPVHLPTASPHLALAAPYPGPLLAIERRAFDALAPSTDSFHALVLQVLTRVPRIARLPLLLAATGRPFGSSADPQAATDALGDLGLTGWAIDCGTPFLEVRLRPRSWPSVTAVVPTRDRGDLLERAVHGLRARTLYPNVRIVIVDNDSTDASTLRLMADYARNGTAQIVPAPGDFNFSRIVNLALKHVTTPLTLLLNNDVTPSHPRWLEQMVANLDASDVGIVGSLLRYPDGTIQHAGIVLGLGGAAGHPFEGSSDDGYLGWSAARREVAAVTGACMLARTEDLRSVGGLDEGLVRDFQDVDLCLRLRERRGLSTIIDPLYPMTHEGSASRGRADADQSDAARFRARWGKVVDNDPYYSPRLSRINPGYLGS